MNRNYESIQYYVDKLHKGDLEYRDGEIFNVKFNRYVKGSLHGKGKYKGFFSKAKGVHKKALMHLVIFAYHHGIEELKKHETVDHVDGDKHNNRIENLQGCSILENNRRWQKRNYTSK